MPAPIFRGIDHLPGEVIVAASADYKTTDPTPVILEVSRAVGLRLNINVTAASGGGGVTVNIDFYEAASDSYITVLSSALIVAPGFSNLKVDPRIVASANSVAQSPLPPSIRIRPIGSGTRTTLTYSLGAVLSL